LCRQGLEDGHEPIRYSLRGSVYSIIRVNLKPALNTEILTPPGIAGFGHIAKLSRSEIQQADLALHNVLAVRLLLGTCELFR
ncbi:hypothetical protein ACUHMQ_18490, partial [Chitinimonas sp. PSY-7]|uniref:hypothetical protein n=1 Tax=Chitinimonas sp. PSY-7 TaxID=3459088 RepID=UPI00403FD568